MDVLFHPEAAAELDALPIAEKLPMDHAVEKLEVLGDRLPFPHTSAVKGADRLRRAAATSRTKSLAGLVPANRPSHGRRGRRS